MEWLRWFGGGTPLLTLLLVLLWTLVGIFTVTGRRDGAPDWPLVDDVDSMLTVDAAAAAAERNRSAPSRICKGHMSVRPFTAMVDIWTVNSWDGWHGATTDVTPEIGMGIFCCFPRPCLNAVNVRRDDLRLAGDDGSSSNAVPLDFLVGNMSSIDEGTKRYVSALAFLRVDSKLFCLDTKILRPVSPPSCFSMILPTVLLERRWASSSLANKRHRSRQVRGAHGML